jgi:hypothetical protein
MVNPGRPGVKRAAKKAAPKRKKAAKRKKAKKK